MAPKASGWHRMGAQMQRGAYSRGCGASTAKRPAALGYAGAGPAQRATGSRLSEAARRQDPLLLSYAHQQTLVLARREHHVEPDNQHGDVEGVQPDGPGQLVRGKRPSGDDRAHALENMSGRIEPRDRLEPIRHEAQRIEDAGDRQE